MLYQTLYELLIALHDDDKPRRRAIRKAAYMLVKMGERDSRIVALSCISTE